MFSQTKTINDKQNESNLSINLSSIKLKPNENKQSLSSNRSGIKSAVPNLNLSRTPNKKFIGNSNFKMGPSSTREATKAAILNQSRAKLGSLNDSKSLNNSVLLNNSVTDNTTTNGHTRSKSQNLQNEKNTSKIIKPHA